MRVTRERCLISRNVVLGSEDESVFYGVIVLLYLYMHAGRKNMRQIKRKCLGCSDALPDDVDVLGSGTEMLMERHPSLPPPARDTPLHSGVNSFGVCII